ncbi:unnamed protein product, partial [Tuber aestivum]
VWLDRKLLFNYHVKQKTAAATRALNMISRLSNSEWGLSAPAIRQLYYTCITPIADYGAEVWWKGQIGLANKLQKLQAEANRRILGAFRTSPTAAMEIEAATLRIPLRLDRQCKRYAYRVLQMLSDHPIRQRTPSSFPSTLSSSIPLDRPCSSSSEMLNTLSSFLPVGQDVEQCYPNLQPPWDTNLPDTTSRLDITISQEDKDTAAKSHITLLNSLDNSENLVLYTDGSELQNGGVGAGVVMMHGGGIVGRWRVGLGCGMKVYDGELVGIASALTEASRSSLSFKHILVFTDNQAAISNSHRLSPHPGQQISQQIQQLTKDLLSSDLDIQLHLSWVPSHTGIQGNDEADRLAKQAAEYPQPDIDSFLSLTKLKTQIKQSALKAWHQYWTQLQPAKQGRHYRSIHFHLPSLHPPLHFFQLHRPQLATVTQLRLGHGCFNTYLSRLDENVSDRCSCTKSTPPPQTPEHLILYCSRYQQHRHLLRS